MTNLFPQIDMPIRIEISNLMMSRDNNVLFEDLSTTISSGDVLWIQGNNGIGKTTLLEALVGLSRPDSGQVIWYQANQKSSPNSLVAYQPHKSFAKPTMTTEEDLMFWAKFHQNVGLVNPVLDYIGLNMKKSVPTQKLSTGQRRRVALAKLIISKKPIWIMDEPGAAMDEDGMALINNLVSHHIKRGGSAIIASHDATRKLSVNTRKLTLKAST